MKTHILRPDSITPMWLYLERAAAEPGSYHKQLDLAAALAYREREYRAMYWSRWLKGEPPGPSPDSPFAPFDLTPDAAVTLRFLLGTPDALSPGEPGVPRPDDLFGLKASVTDGLLQTLRPITAHRLGWLTAAQLLFDLCRYRGVVDAAETVVTLGEPLQGLALVSQAAVIGTLGSDPIPNGERLAREAGTRARRLKRTGTGNRTWARDALNALDERLRQLGIRTRLRVEGQTFGKFLVSEREFCEQARAEALEGFSIERVPPDLRDLADLARAIGTGDDPCRTVLVRRMTAGERRRAVQRVEAHEARIAEWLKSVGEPPYPVEAAAFFWLLEAIEEIRVGLHSR